jgi:hypothetical protein
LNIWAVFTHALGDAAASTFVVLTGLLMKYFDPHLEELGDCSPNENGVCDCEEIDDFIWVDYCDPISSMVLVAFIMYTAWPILTSAAHILLEGTPQSISYDEVTNRLLRIQGVTDVSSLQLFQLGSDAASSVGMVHLLTHLPVSSEDMYNDAKRVLNSFGVHTTTIQIISTDKGKQEGSGGGGSCSGHGHGHAHGHHHGAADLKKKEVTTSGLDHGGHGHSQGSGGCSGHGHGHAHGHSHAAAPKSPQGGHAHGHSHAASPKAKVPEIDLFQGSVFNKPQPTAAQVELSHFQFDEGSGDDDVVV